MEQRKRLQDHCQREVAEVQTRLAALDRQLAELNDAVHAESAEIRRGNLVGIIDLAYWSAHRRFTIAMQDKAAVITREMAALNEKLDAARQRLLAAVVQYKAIDKLRERQASRWQQEHNRKERLDLDEASSRAGFSPPQ